MGIFSKYEILHLDPSEKVIFEVRKHWIVFLRTILNFIVVVLAPIVLEIVLVSYIPVTAIVIHNYFSTILFFYILWFLLAWVKFFLNWTKYFLDVWYVTDSRIIDIEQEKIFYRVISNLRFDKIQDITVEVPGFFATFLNYGNIRVQTASENERDFYMEQVRDPEGVKRVIFSQHNIVGDKDGND